MSDECAATGTCENGTCVNSICVRSILVAPGVECTSADESLGEFDTFSKCEAACIEKTGCKYFIYGRPGTEKAGLCYWEKTTSAACPEGFEADDYNFHSLDIDDGVGMVTFDQLEQPGSQQQPSLRTTRDVVDFGYQRGCRSTNYRNHPDIKKDGVPPDADDAVCSMNLYQDYYGGEDLQFDKVIGPEVGYGAKDASPTDDDKKLLANPGWRNYPSGHVPVMVELSGEIGKEGIFHRNSNIVRRGGTVAHPKSEYYVAGCLGQTQDDWFDWFGTMRSVGPAEGFADLTDWTHECTTRAAGKCDNPTPGGEGGCIAKTDCHWAWCNDEKGKDLACLSGELPNNATHSLGNLRLDEVGSAESAPLGSAGCATSTCEPAFKSSADFCGRTTERLQRYSRRYVRKDTTRGNEYDPTNDDMHGYPLKTAVDVGATRDATLGSRNIERACCLGAGTFMQGKGEKDEHPEYKAVAGKRPLGAPCKQDADCWDGQAGGTVFCHDKPTKFFEWTRDDNAANVNNDASDPENSTTRRKNPTASEAWPEQEGGPSFKEFVWPASWTCRRRCGNAGKDDSRNENIKDEYGAAWIDSSYGDSYTINELRARAGIAWGVGLGAAALTGGLGLIAGAIAVAATEIDNANLKKSVAKQAQQFLASSSKNTFECGFQQRWKGTTGNEDVNAESYYYNPVFERADKHRDDTDGFVCDYVNQHCETVDNESDCNDTTYRKQKCYWRDGKCGSYVYEYKDCGGAFCRGDEHDKGLYCLKNCGWRVGYDDRHGAMWTGGADYPGTGADRRSYFDFEQADGTAGFICYEGARRYGKPHREEYTHAGGGVCVDKLGAVTAETTKEACGNEAVWTDALKLQREWRDCHDEDTQCTAGTEYDEWEHPDAGLCDDDAYDSKEDCESSGADWKRGDKREVQAGCCLLRHDCSQSGLGGSGMAAAPAVGENHTVCPFDYEDHRLKYDTDGWWDKVDSDGGVDGHKFKRYTYTVPVGHFPTAVECQSGQGGGDCAKNIEIVDKRCFYPVLDGTTCWQPPMRRDPGGGRVIDAGALTEDTECAPGWTERTWGICTKDCTRSYRKEQTVGYGFSHPNCADCEGQDDANDPSSMCRETCSLTSLPHCAGRTEAKCETPGEGELLGCKWESNECVDPTVTVEHGDRGLLCQESCGVHFDKGPDHWKNNKESQELCDDKSKCSQWQAQRCYKHCGRDQVTVGLEGHAYLCRDSCERVLAADEGSCAIKVKSSSGKDYIVRPGGVPLTNPKNQPPALLQSMTKNDIQQVCRAKPEDSDALKVYSLCAKNLYVKKLSEAQTAQKKDLDDEVEADEAAHGTKGGSETSATQVQADLATVEINKNTSEKKYTDGAAKQKTAVRENIKATEGGSAKSADGEAYGAVSGGGDGGGPSTPEMDTAVADAESAQASDTAKANARADADAAWEDPESLYQTGFGCAFPGDEKKPEEKYRNRVREVWGVCWEDCNTDCEDCREDWYEDEDALNFEECNNGSQPCRWDGWTQDIMLTSDVTSALVGETVTQTANVSTSSKGWEPAAGDKGSASLELPPDATADEIKSLKETYAKFGSDDGDDEDESAETKSVTGSGKVASVNPNTNTISVRMSTCKGVDNCSIEFDKDTPIKVGSASKDIKNLGLSYHAEGSFKKLAHDPEVRAAATCAEQAKDNPDLFEACLDTETAKETAKGSGSCSCDRGAFCQTDCTSTMPKGLSKYVDRGKRNKQGGWNYTPGICWSRCPEGYYDAGVWCLASCDKLTKLSKDGEKTWNGNVAPKYIGEWSKGWNEEGIPGAHWCAAGDTHYGRGWGTPWILDDGFDYDTSAASQIARCEEDNGLKADEKRWLDGEQVQGCSMCLAIAYPNCPDGYHEDGCNICAKDGPWTFTPESAGGHTTKLSWVTTRFKRSFVPATHVKQSYTPYSWGMSTYPMSRVKNSFVPVTRTRRAYTTASRGKDLTTDAAYTIGRERNAWWWDKFKSVSGSEKCCMQGCPDASGQMSKGCVEVKKPPKETLSKQPKYEYPPLCRTVWTPGKPHVPYNHVDGGEDMRCSEKGDDACKADEFCRWDGDTELCVAKGGDIAGTKGYVTNTVNTWGQSCAKHFVGEKEGAAETKAWCMESVVEKTRMAFDGMCYYPGASHGDLLTPSIGDASSKTEYSQTSERNCKTTYRTRIGRKCGGKKTPFNLLETCVPQYHKCAAGQWNSGYCQDCPAGRASPVEHTSSSCTPMEDQCPLQCTPQYHICPAGQWNSGYCQDCPAGRASPVEHTSSSCTPMEDQCPPGLSFKEGIDACRARCDADKKCKAFELDTKTSQCWIVKASETNAVSVRRDPQPATTSCSVRGRWTGPELRAAAADGALDAMPDVTWLGAVEGWTRSDRRTLLLPFNLPRAYETGDGTTRDIYMSIDDEVDVWEEGSPRGRWVKEPEYRMFRVAKKSSVYERFENRECAGGASKRVDDIKSEDECAAKCTESQTCVGYQWGRDGDEEKDKKVCKTYTTKMDLEPQYNSDHRRIGLRTVCAYAGKNPRLARDSDKKLIGFDTEIEPVADVPEWWANCGRLKEKECGDNRKCTWNDTVCAPRQNPSKTLGSDLYTRSTVNELRFGSLTVPLPAVAHLYPGDKVRLGKLGTLNKFVIKRYQSSVLHGGDMCRNWMVGQQEDDENTVVHPAFANGDPIEGLPDDSMGPVMDKLCSEYNKADKSSSMLKDALDWCNERVQHATGATEEAYRVMREHYEIYHEWKWAEDTVRQGEDNEDNVMKGTCSDPEITDKLTCESTKRTDGEKEKVETSTRESTKKLTEYSLLESMPSCLPDLYTDFNTPARACPRWTSAGAAGTFCRKLRNAYPLQYDDKISEFCNDSRNKLLPACDCLSADFVATDRESLDRKSPLNCNAADGAEMADNYEIRQTFCKARTLLGEDMFGNVMIPFRDMFHPQCQLEWSGQNKHILRPEKIVPGPNRMCFDRDSVISGKKCNFKDVDCNERKQPATICANIINLEIDNCIMVGADSPCGLIDNIQQSNKCCTQTSEQCKEMDKSECSKKDNNCTWGEVNQQCKTRCYDVNVSKTSVGQQIAMSSGLASARDPNPTRIVTKQQKSEGYTWMGGTWSANSTGKKCSIAPDVLDKLSTQDGCISPATWVDGTCNIGDISESIEKCEGLGGTFGLQHCYNGDTFMPNLMSEEECTKVTYAVKRNHTFDSGLGKAGVGAAVDAAELCATTSGCVGFVMLDSLQFQLVTGDDPTLVPEPTFAAYAVVH